jgi:hypothetical protein
MSAPLQRDHWNGKPTCPGDLFPLTKPGSEKPLGAEQL